MKNLPVHLGWILLLVLSNICWLAVYRDVCMERDNAQAYIESQWILHDMALRAELQ